MRHPYQTLWNILMRREREYESFFLCPFPFALFPLLFFSFLLTHCHGSLTKIIITSRIVALHSSFDDPRLARSPINWRTIQELSTGTLWSSLFTRSMLISTLRDGASLMSSSSLESEWIVHPCYNCRGDWLWSVYVWAIVYETMEGWGTDTVNNEDAFQSNEIELWNWTVKLCFLQQLFFNIFYSNITLKFWVL